MKYLFSIALISASIFLSFGVSQANAAEGLVESWSNSQNLSTNYNDYKGTTAKVTINLKSQIAKSVTLRKETFFCDEGAAKACGKNPTVTYETVSLSPDVSVTKSLSRSVTNNCGSAQVDFYVTDNTTGIKTGPYWDMAYTGKDCETFFPACPPIPGSNLPDGKKWDVGYTEGLHWIVGNPVLQKGADYVYFLGGNYNPKSKVLQCFYPKRASRPNIQTDWLAKSNGTIGGWTIVNDGRDFGLLPTRYLAINSYF